MKNDRAELAVQIALNGEGQVPEWIELIPSGPDVVGRDGRRFTLRDPAAFAENFNQAAQPVPLDWEHSSYHKASKGERADAAGWIEKLDVRSGSIWGRVEWTAEGRSTVMSRAYRFVSPAFTYTKAGEVVRLIHAGLTNQPNLTLAALNAEDPDNNKEADIMSLKPITDALGLVDGASADQVVTAINALKAEHQTALNSAAKPDPEKYIPKAEHELALNRIGQFETVEKERAEREITKAVDALIEMGDPNHPPAKRDDYLAICREEGGLDRFKRLFKGDFEKALNKTQVANKPAPGSAGSSLTDEERVAINQLGLTEEQYLTEKKGAE